MNTIDADDAFSQTDGPRYLQIRERLRQEILNGTLPPDHRLPTEATLMARYAVSRVTVRKALDALRRDGLISSVQGSGTFVSRPRAIQDIGRLLGLRETMSKLSAETHSRVLTAGEIGASAAVAQALRVKRGSPIVEIKRLRYVNRIRVSYHLSYYPSEIGRKIMTLDLAGNDVFPLLETKLGIDIGVASLKIDIVSADAEMATQLQVPHGAPLLHVERVTATGSGAPLDYQHLYGRGDVFQLSARVPRW